MNDPFDNPVFSGTFQMILAAAVMVANGRFFTSGTKRESESRACDMSVVMFLAYILWDILEKTVPAISPPDAGALGLRIATRQV